MSAGGCDIYMGQSAAKAGSKRSSLRFHFKEKLPVSYKTAYKDGKALLIDISTSGCFVQDASVPVDIGEKILVSFSIRNLDEPLEIQAVCARLDGDGFAVRYLGIDVEEQNRLVKLLAAQARAKGD